MASSVYDAKEVTVIVDGVTVVGFADGDMVTCTKDENNITVVEDAQGSASAAINNSKIGTIQIMLAQTSPNYRQLVNLANSRRVVPTRVVNGSETIGGSQALVEKLPDTTFGSSVGSRQFTLKVLDYTHSV